MPSSSKKQHKFMEAVAHNPAFAKKAGVPQTVGQDFSNADKGKKFNRGGAMPMDPKMLAMMAEKLKGRTMGGRPAARPPMGARPPMAMPGMKKGGSAKMASGGMPMVMKDGKKMPAFAADGEGKMKKGGMAGMHKMPDGKMMKDSAMKHGGSAKKMMGGGMAYSKGGSASSRADGIAIKGKTKGKMLKKGGTAC